MSQSALGQLIGKDAQSVARWEKRGRVPKMAERMIRLVYRDCLDGQVGTLKEIVARLNKIDRQAYEKMKFERGSHGWKAKAARQSLSEFPTAS
ncbi:MAG: hypothetical protein ACREFW_06840 [Rhizomicrobium sp.]